MNPLFVKIKKHFNREGFFYRSCKGVYCCIYNVFSKYGYVRQYIIFPISAFFRKKHVPPFYDKNAKLIESLRNRYNGSRCFIVATGPSLTIDDVERLNDELTIGVNSLYKLYNRTDFRPNYYVVLDAEVQKVVEEHINDYEVFCKNNIFMNALRKVSNENVNYLSLCYQDHWFNIGNNKYDYGKNLRYSTDAIEGFYDKYTITNLAIELAIYMGCKDIYLLGVDCNYTGPQVHFDGADDMPRQTYDMAYHTQEAMMTGYRFMERETKKRGIHILNATRGGMLEEFERVDFDTLF